MVVVVLFICMVTTNAQSEVKVSPVHHDVPGGDKVKRVL